MRWLLLLGAGALLMTAAQKTGPRGIRNNNPGNIRGSDAFTWVGEIGRDDKGFVIFDTPENGFRAMARTIDTYRHKHGLESVAGIIGRWAPRVENITASYVAHVADALGVDPFEPITRADYPVLLATITKHENGQQPYSMETINAGIAAA